MPIMIVSVDADYLEQMTKAINNKHKMHATFLRDCISEMYSAAHYREVDGEFCVEPDTDTGQVCFC